HARRRRRRAARGARLRRRSAVRPHADLDSRALRRFASESQPESRDRQVDKFIVRKAAVLGAGVMGAQIAAHLVNAKVAVVLFDLPAKEGPRNGIAARAVDGLRRLNPAPLGRADLAAEIEVANYDDD